MLIADCFESAHVAQSAEHILGKDEVTSSILVMGSMTNIVAVVFFDVSKTVI